MLLAELEVEEKVSEIHYIHCLCANNTAVALVSKSYGSFLKVLDPYMFSNYPLLLCLALFACFVSVSRFQRVLFINH